MAMREARAKLSAARRTDRRHAGTPAASLALALIFTAAAATVPAVAQAADPGSGAPAAPSSRPAPKAHEAHGPELLEFVKAVYPEEALHAGRTGVVLLRIDIDAFGSVTDVKVETPAGHGFDEAAVAAARRFRFKPASVDGVPAASRILYPYRFELLPPAPLAPPAPAPGSAVAPGAAPAAPASAPASGPTPPAPESAPAAAPSAPGEVSFVGEVLVRGLRDPITDAEVSVPSLGVAAVTGAGGKFALRLPPGRHTVVVAAPGFVRVEEAEDFPAGKEVDVTYYLAAVSTGFRTTVRDKRAVREIAVRDVSSEEISRIPGTNGDAFKVVQILPGVARAPADFGLIVVRGSDPEDTRYFFMGSPILGLYHFGGLRAIINSDMMERLDFLPGGFGVRYGRAMGGVLDVEPRLANADRFHGYLDTNVFDTGVFLEGPIPVTPNLGFMAGYRRSYIDAVLPVAFDLFNLDDGARFTVAPRYWDYQTIVSWVPTKHDDVRLMVFGSVDKVSLLISDADLPDTGIRGDINNVTWFHRAIARWKTRLAPRLTNEMMVSAGTGAFSFAAGIDFYFFVKIQDVAVRDELTATLSDSFSLALGLDAQLAGYSVGFRSPIPFEEDRVPEPLSTSPIFEFADRDVYFDYALYAEGRWTPFKPLLVVPGVRMDYYWFDRDATVDPRVAVRFRAHDRLTLKGSAGRYSQPPTGANVVEPFGSPAARHEYAWQYVVGFEVKITDLIDLDVQGYWKDMRHLLVSPTPAELSTPAPDINLGRGTVYGLEVLLRHRFGHDFFGWVSYTLSRATRIDRPGEDPYPFDFDQTHILALVAHYRLPWGFEVGARWRYVTGSPSTPLLGGIYDADADGFLFVPGRLNSTRVPPFHQLDVRVDKTFTFKTWSLAVYLDVQNVYNRKNPEGEIYDFDFENAAYVHGLPFIPSLGLKGAF
ncbi:MAG TPA: TonB-dependent receptor [Myxococcota bacterium]|nr:TonB-dependent receptor [Myxococcota bacterium]